MQGLGSSAEEAARLHGAALTTLGQSVERAAQIHGSQIRQAADNLGSSAEEAARLHGAALTRHMRSHFYLEQYDDCRQC